jgi:pyruvate formate lyase activating enzyme
MGNKKESGEPVEKMGRLRIKMNETVVFNIQRMSIHDGPGIRTTVFVKGCVLRCAWCHNPESWSKKPEVLWSAERCLGCGLCATVCEQKGIAFEDGKRVWARDKCIACGACASVCGGKVIEMVGQAMSTDEVLAIVEKDRVFYEESGGGVTVSGGEPLMAGNAAFTKELLAKCQAKKIHTNIQTSLCVEWAVVEDTLTVLDFLQADLKAVDKELHRRLTGVENEKILENIRRLGKKEIPMEIRIPVVPGMNDAREEIERMAEFMSGLDRSITVELLAYHSLGESKFRRMVKKYSLEGLKGPGEERMAEIRNAFERKNVRVKK